MPRKPKKAKTHAELELERDCLKEARKVAYFHMSVTDNPVFAKKARIRKRTPERIKNVIDHLQLEEGGNAPHNPQERIRALLDAALMVKESEGAGTTDVDPLTIQGVLCERAEEHGWVPPKKKK